MSNMYICYQSLAIDDVIDKDMMLDWRPLSYGSAIELKSIMLIPPPSDKLFIDSLKLEYFSRFFSRFDLQTRRQFSINCLINFLLIFQLLCKCWYLNVGALYLVLACIRSLAKCCCADNVGAAILFLSRHHSTWRSYARAPNDLSQCGHILFICPNVRFVNERFINEAVSFSFSGIFNPSDFVGVTRRLAIFVESSYMLVICKIFKQHV